MACTITLGRALDCKDALGGLSRIFFVSDFADGLVTAAGTGDGTAGSATVATASGESFTVTDLPARRLRLGSPADSRQPQRQRRDV